MERLRAFFRDERGGEMPEYAVVVGLIIVVGAAIFVMIGTNLDLIFRALNGLLTDAVAGLPE